MLASFILAQTDPDDIQDQQPRGIDEFPEPTEQMPDSSVDYLPDIVYFADLSGVFFFAVSGALLASRRGFDIIGSALLAALTGLGGGVVRDVIINAGVPNAFASPSYMIPVALAVLLVYIRVIDSDRLRRTILVFDAGGLAVFCVVGTLIATDAGLPVVSATLLGAATAVFGGLLRDVVANQIPAIFNPHDIYAIPAVSGAAVVAILNALDVYEPLWGAVTAVAVFSFRLVALRFKWHAPSAAFGGTFAWPWQRLDPEPDDEEDLAEELENERDEHDDLDDDPDSDSDDSDPDHGPDKF
ncbi:trimeric intracellular cation channel family protein [Auritidibacter ignavus]|uniref:trimeric intracellular cation channel family protein n=1 Tax=Auritidibacter ignavus TaxID=678932 RepID=UPI003133A718